MTGAATGLPIEVDERHEAARLPADDRQRERQTEPSGAYHRLRMPADRDPHRQRILNGAWKDGEVIDRRAVGATPRDPLALADLQEKAKLFLEEVVVVRQVIAEQRERLGERAASRHDFGASVGDEIERREVLKDPDGIVGAENTDRAREADAFRAGGRGRKDDGGSRDHELPPVMLPHAVHVEADLVRELDLV